MSVPCNCRLPHICLLFCVMQRCLLHKIVNRQDKCGQVGDQSSKGARAIPGEYQQVPAPSVALELAPRSRLVRRRDQLELIPSNSTSSHQMCPMAMWHSWMRAVFAAGTVT